jgi:hypothetical protein
MTNKLRAPEDIEFILIEPKVVDDWFKRIMGSNDHYRHESVVANFLVAHSEHWTGERPEAIWQELHVGAGLRPDVILQYPNKVWVIEVKDRVDPQWVFENDEYESAVDQLRAYCSQIGRNGWWPRRKVLLSALWAYLKEDAEKGLPIVVDSRTMWPRTRTGRVEHDCRGKPQSVT